ncbi:hypothetical protein BGP77_08140 [Saccharospirillum sp. MSK14-1]|uniref:hypothetical protein n=1 Tax=Saccharospirillum sp. MSK14-1 TaxID=1897632 RepID=UPI000D3D01C2|nr:hypothetical protein [Saccharospirillum sp. MSK14-1]PTY37224.1 hypothetical protein BGP77_08140 [Saccharospirillum sp. MSK14-1]
MVSQHPPYVQTPLHHLRSSVLMMGILSLVWALIPTRAEDVEVEVGLVTHHWISDDLNDENRLVGAGYKNWELSTFVNSFGDRSYSAGYRWHLSRSFSVSSGVIHGYGENADWFPVTLDDEVIYLIVNAEPPVDGPLGLRLRLMGEATVVSLVLRPRNKIQRLGRDEFEEGDGLKREGDSPDRLNREN